MVHDIFDFRVLCYAFIYGYLLCSDRGLLAQFKGQSQLTHVAEVGAAFYDMFVVDL